MSGHIGLDDPFELDDIDTDLSLPHVRAVFECPNVMCRRVLPDDGVLVHHKRSESDVPKMLFVCRTGSRVDELSTRVAHCHMDQALGHVFR